MKRVINFLKDPLFFPMLIPLAIYIFWLFTIPMYFRWFDDNFWNYSAGLILLGIYLLITALAKAASSSWKFSTLFIVLALPLLYFLIPFMTWFLSDNIFFLIGILLATVPPIITLLLNFKSKHGKTRLVLFTVTIPILGANLMYLSFFYPTILDKAKLGSNTYYVVSASDWDNHSFDTFYKCQKWRIGCDYLYASYSESIGKLLVDEQKKEVSLLGFNGPVYTDGDDPREYASNGLGTQLGDHTYDLAQECNNFNKLKGYYACESYTYTLYECDLNNESCTSLPIQYTDTDPRNFLRLEPDETHNEINLYEEYFESDKVLLIYTWGEHPRCHVEGCEILEK